MHIVTVEKFLFCFKLETGGFVLGWLGAVSSFIGFISLLALGILGVIYFDSFVDAVKEQNLSTGEFTNDWIIKLLTESSACKFKPFPLELGN
jgi:hypothetical protein